MLPATTNRDHPRPDADTPDAAARLVLPNSLVIDACPFCGKRHTHGAGTPDAGTLPGTQVYGYRAAHCRTGTGGSYRLVPAGADQ